MNRQAFVESVAYPCCVLLVRKTAGEGCGEIRIVAANTPQRQIMGACLL